MTSDQSESRVNRWERCQWGVYAITDAGLSGRTHEEVAAAVLEAGVRVIQLRDKQLTFEDLLAVGRRLRAMTSEAGATLIVNDNPYLAVEINADGCHIGQEDFPPHIARDVIGPDRILGLSTHSAHQALAAQLEPIDYIGIGPVYRTTTKQSHYDPVGLNLIRWARQTISFPIVAIGGITAETLPAVVQAGAHNVAIIGDLVTAPDIRRKATELMIACNDALSGRQESPHGGDSRKL